MGKNKARHILHGVLDCLPIILIPIFMIYSQNHEINDNTLQVQENREVNFNQLASANYSTYKNNYFIDVNKSVATNQTEWVSLNTNIEYELNHVYYLRIRQLENAYNGDYILLANNANDTRTFLDTYPYGRIFTMTTIPNNSFGMVFGNLHPQNTNIEFYVNLIDLTFMFGAGNEPSQSQFDEWYTENYYEYTTYTKEFIPGYEVTYDDTDIMSQSFYCLYNAVDKYFNMGNVFGMKNLYNWFEVNIFGGNASPSIYIVWNIVLYEFIMDLLFLLYGLFMFFIDLCKRLMEKPLNSIK